MESRAKFKVGDRVRVVQCSFGDAEPGQQGTVAEISDICTSVEMDPPFKGHGETGHCWNFFDPQNELVPAATAAATLTIQAGRCYRTRDGRKVGPMLSYNWSVTPAAIEVVGDGRCWAANGGRAVGYMQPSNDDLIAEWIDEPAAATKPVAVAGSNDNGPAPVAGQLAAKFRVGDKVRLVREGLSTTGAIGLTAVIKRIDEASRWPFLLRFDQSDLHRFSSEAITRELTRAVVDDIEAIEENAPNKAIVCLIENGQPKPAVVPFIHTSRSGAEREATRLAGKHKGKEFGVFDLVGTKREAAPVYAHEWQRLAAEGQRDEAAAELHRLTGMRHSDGRYIADRYAA
jgi:hypothetical protein